MADSSPNILQRIHAVMKEVKYVRKEKKSGMQYSIVSHDVVTAKLRPSIVNNGIVYWPVNLQLTQSGNRTEAVGAVRFASMDNLDDYIDVWSAGYGIDSQDKGPGKAISYLVKYALLKCFGLETGDDPDLDQEVVYDDGQVDPLVENISTFLDRVQEAKTVEDLEGVVKAFGVYIKDAKPKYPGRVAAAMETYNAKKKELTK